MSPHLAYLRNFPMQHGALLFRVGSRPEDVYNAVEEIKKAKLLYETENTSQPATCWFGRAEI